MEKLGQHCSRRFRAPAEEPWIAVRGIADQREVVRDRCRGHPEFLHYGSLIQGDACPTVQLYDARAGHTLREVLVGRADDNAMDTFISSCCRRRRGEGVVGLEFHHRPDHDSGCRENLFEQRELCPQAGFNRACDIEMRFWWVSFFWSIVLKYVLL